MYTKGNFYELYYRTPRIDVTNKIVFLEENKEKKNIPYSNISEIQLRFLDCGGEVGISNTNPKLFSGMKALIILFDLTNTKSFKNLKNTMSNCKNNYTKCRKLSLDYEDTIINQKENYKEIPIFIVGNKSDLSSERTVQKHQIDEFMTKKNKDHSYSFLKYYEISAKNNSGIEAIFQDIIFYYFKRKIDNDAINKKNISENNQNKIKENIEEKIEEIKKEDKKEDKKEEKKEETIKKPSLDKNMLIYHQMLDKIKKKFIVEISSLKEENKKEIDKNKKIEEKIELISKDFNNEKNILKEKINVFENKANELEQKLKLKDEEIQNLKQKVNELIILNKEITLKFKISDENIKDEITINTKGEAKISEVLSMLYELCPYINNMNIKGFCIEGKENQKIDEMKTVSENKLENGSLIVLMI